MNKYIKFFSSVVYLIHEHEILCLYTSVWSIWDTKKAVDLNFKAYNIRLFAANVTAH